MGSSQEMLSTCGPRDEQWQWLDRALLMAPFPYGCLGLPQFPEYLFHGLSRNVHSPSFLDSGFLSQIFFKNKADNGIRLLAINQASALKRTTSNLLLPAHLVFHLNLCMSFQNASSLALPLWTLLLRRPNLGSTFLLPWKPSGCSSFLLCTHGAYLYSVLFKNCLIHVCLIFPTIYEEKSIC